MAALVEKKEAWESLKITERTLDRWRKEPDFPPTDDGYDVSAIREWVNDREKKGSETDSQIATINRAIKLEKLKEIRQKNQMLELELAAKQRGLLPREDVHQVLMEFAGLMRVIGKQIQQSGNTSLAKSLDVQIERMRKLIHDRLGRPKESSEE